MQVKNVWLWGALVGSYTMLLSMKDLDIKNIHIKIKKKNSLDFDFVELDKNFRRNSFDIKDNNFEPYKMLLIKAKSATNLKKTTIEITKHIPPNRKKTNSTNNSSTGSN